MESIRWAFNFRNWSPRKEDWMLCFSVIQPEEKERISKFVFQKDLKATLAGRLMIRKVVSEKFNLPWSRFTLKRTEKGRPYFDQDKVKFDFNVSHQGKWVVLAAESNGTKVGVDIMEIERGTNKSLSEFFRLMRRQFTTDEWKIINKYENENYQLKAFYRNWCLKEAFVKALGVGISYDLQSISFIPHSELNLGNIITNTEVKVGGSLDYTWKFEESLIDEKHIATVAFQHSSSGSDTNFKVLSYEDLILNSEQIIDPDSELAERTMLKLESPY